MDAADIIKIIKRRKDEFSDLQLIGTAEDLPVFSEADVVRAKADEYDSLLAEIEGLNRRSANRLT
ncbi:MAG: hypothetical protein ABSA80_13360 [Terriglobales bacterium]|jgi:hypothetical protein